MGVHIYTAPPPWEVPRKRKSRGTLRGGRDCYDPIEGNIYTLGGENINTYNRYSPLRDVNDDMKEALHTLKRLPDSSPTQKRKKTRTVYFDNFEEFYKKNSVNFMYDLFDNSSCMMYSNKYNMCSGYFPDFILSPNLNNDNYKGVYSKNIDFNSFSNDSPNFNYNSVDYYPNFRNGKYSKQISNANSKYNNSYFHKLKPAYKICKKFRESLHNSKYEYKISSNSTSRSQLLYPPDYERVVKSSERGTLGDFNKQNHFRSHTENKVSNNNSNTEKYNGRNNSNYVLNNNSLINSNNHNNNHKQINLESKYFDGKHHPRQSPNSERGDMGDLGGSGSDLILNLKVNNNMKGAGVGNYNSSRPKYSNSNDKNNNNSNNNLSNNKIAGNSQFPSKLNSDHPDQLFRSTHKNNTNLHTRYGEVKVCRYGNYSGVGQFQPHYNSCKPGQHDQYPGRDHTYRGGGDSKL